MSRKPNAPEISAFQIPLDTEEAPNKLLVNRMQFAAAKGGFFLGADLTCDLIVRFFENNGIEIVHATRMDELCDGMECWEVTLFDDSTFKVWSISGLIEFVYNGKLYTDIPLY